LNNVKNNFMNNTRDQQFERGFSLIEVLVASFIFAVVATISISIFTMSANVQTATGIKRTAAQDERFSLEEISRNIRLADGGFKFCSSRTICTGNSGNYLNLYQLDSSGNPVLFKTYGLSGSNLVVVDSVGNEQSLFSSEFYVSESAGSPIFSGYYPSPVSTQQPYVTILFTIDNIQNQKANKKSEEMIQTLRTSVTSRAYSQVGVWAQ